MTKRYTGGVVSSSLPTVNAAGASGVFLLSQQADYQSRNSWPPFKVEESLRFRRSVSGHLNRTPAIASDRRTWTWSGWVKLGLLGVTRQIFGTTGNSVQSALVFEAADTLFAFSENASQTFLRTTQVFRDPSAWYHVVWAEDTTQATSSNRSKLYINGVQITAFSTANYPSQNFQGSINNNATHYISTYDGSTWAHDGYLAEVNFIDGQQLTPSSFGATDKDGNWSPIAYTGTYGTNGFYLNFSNNTSATTMGSDSSGNGNNWTLNNFNVSTANTTYDIMIDVPEDQDSSNVRSNYATLNPLAMYGTNATISDGSLTTGATSTSNDRGYPSTIAAPGSGKWYAEFTFTATSGDNNGGCGIMLENGTGAPGESATTVSWRDFGTLRQNASGTTYGSALTTNDVVIVAYDAALGRVWFGKNGTWFASGDPATNANPSATGITTTGRFAAYHYNASATIRANFGQRPFAYTPPSGFKSLNTFNLPEPTIKQPNKQFDVNLWTGNGTSQNITNTGVFKPDLVWVKQRNGTYRHQLVDAIRGVTRSLFSSDSDAEATYQGVTAFNSNGFSVGTELGTNENGSTFVGWQWNAGGANTTNTDGTITSIVRANRTAGFSIVTYTGTGNAGVRIGHGLGVAPKMMIVKQRGSTTNWAVYHQSLPSAFNVAGTQVLNLNTTASNTQNFDVWDSNETEFNRFSVGASTLSNASGGTYVAYCFAPIAGYSAFGSYTGNGSSDGPFVYTGFRPRFIMIKCSSDAQAWIIFDTARNPYNSNLYELYPNLTLADSVDTNGSIDIVSNGFKNRCAASANLNASGQTYIYMAFAEAPFKYARSR